MRRRAPLLVSLLVPGLVSLAAAPAAAGPDPLDPLDRLVGPEPLDPVIDLLPPLPADHTPYDGNVCPDGARECIDVTIAEMQRRLAESASTCHHDAIFDLAYLRVTEDVREATDAGYYADPVWLAQVDAVFAQYYFDTMDAWDAGRVEEVPRAWRIALRAADEKAMTGLGNFLLSMNAHINRDFPFVLAEVGLTGPDGASHRPDHNRYNARLDALYEPVFAEEAARFDPTFDDIDVGPLEETAAGVVMRGWREMVWRHAEQLALARTPAQRRTVARQVEAYAATQAGLIRSTFASPDSSARDAWCAENGA